MPDDAYDLLVKMLKKNPAERLCAKQCLKHDYFNSMKISNFENNDFKRKQICRTSNFDECLKNLLNIYNNLESSDECIYMKQD